MFSLGNYIVGCESLDKMTNWVFHEAVNVNVICIDKEGHFYQTKL